MRRCAHRVETAVHVLRSNRQAWRKILAEDRRENEDDAKYPLVTDAVFDNEARLDAHLLLPRIRRCMSREFVFILQFDPDGFRIAQAAIVFALVTMGDDEHSGDEDNVFHVVRHKHVTALGTLHTCNIACGRRSLMCLCFHVALSIPLCVILMFMLVRVCTR